MLTINYRCCFLDGRYRCIDTKVLAFSGTFLYLIYLKVYIIPINFYIMYTYTKLFSCYIAIIKCKIYY